MKRIAALVLAYFFLALSIIGIFLPGLPTVPFLLLAAWFAARGSERLHKWLYSHPRFGALLSDWQEQKAISRRSKIAAVSMLLTSWVIIYTLSENILVIAGLASLFIAVGFYILSRQEPN
ncbi:MAG: YbaN family protein [Desulfobacterales bacterium]|nr:YbaN family protein [Desulfobacterales bacterium]